MSPNNVRRKTSLALPLTVLVLAAACTEGSPLDPALQVAADRSLAPGQLSFYGMGGLTRSHPSTPCLGDGPHRDFDFWLGDWDITGPDGDVLGANRIKSILDGCVVEEDFTAPSGFRGRSMNSYDAATGTWAQYFFDQGGTQVRLQGGFQNGIMDMRGERLFPIPSGTITLVDRIRWTPHPDGTVAQFWDISIDGGDTFPIVAFNSTYTLNPALSPAPPLDRQFCTNPEFRQLDFLEGTWAVESASGQHLGTSVVRSDLEGCMIEEDFSSPRGYASQSFSGWDFSDGRWNRFVMDTEGVRILMSGGLEGAAMVLEGSRPVSGGETLGVRVAITPESANRVVQTWSTSRDGSKWKERATVVFVR